MSVPEFDPKARELLVAFAYLRTLDEMRRTAVYSKLEEPDLVPEGCYAVVSVEYHPMESLAIGPQSIAMEA